MGFVPTSSLLVEAGDTPAPASSISGDFGGDCILVPLLTPNIPAITDQIRVAASLSRASDARLHVVNPVTMPDRPSTEFDAEITAAQEQELLEWAETNSSPSALTVESQFRYVRKLLNGILATIRSHDIDSIVVPSGSATGFLRQRLTERLALRAECDVITVNGQHGYEGVCSILLAVTGGPHSELATGVAQRIAVDNDAWIDILHVVGEDAPPRQRRQADEYVDRAYQRIDRPETTSKWVLESPNVARAIIEQSEYYGLTVLGAPTTGRLRQFIAGSTNQTVRDGARSVVLSARKNR